MTMATTHTLFSPDDNYEIHLTNAQTHDLLSIDVISVIEDFEPAVEGEVGYTVNDEYEQAFIDSSGPFEFLNHY